MKRCVTLAAACALLLLGALPPAAGDVTGRDRVGDVKGSGLTKAERAALDIVSVRAIGEEGLGVIVVATFRGDVEKAFGRGHLRNALAAMVLHPKSPAQRPSGLLTRGRGQGETFRSTRSEEVEVVRQGRTVTFFLLGPGYSNVGRVEVKTLADFPLSAARSLAGTPPKIGDPELDDVLRESAQDRLRMFIDSGKLDCPALRRMHALVLDKLDESYLSLSRRQYLERVNTKLFDRLRQPPCTAPAPGTPAGALAFAWRLVSSNEVAGSGRVMATPGSQVTAVRVTVPPSGSTQRVITNFLCPTQMPTAQVSANTIVCSGGALALGETFTLNLQTDPVPTVGMGGEIFAQFGGLLYGPSPIARRPAGRALQQTVARLLQASSRRLRASAASTASTSSSEL